MSDDQINAYKEEITARKDTRDGYDEFLREVKGRIQAAQLRTAFPGVAGFSQRNLSYMRAFAEAYPEPEIVQQLLDNSPLPWGHHVRVLALPLEALAPPPQ